MTGSGKLSPGRALRPEVRLNKEQEEAVMKRLTAEELEALEKLVASVDMLHGHFVDGGCKSMGVAQQLSYAEEELGKAMVDNRHALLAMASKLVELESHDAPLDVPFGCVPGDLERELKDSAETLADVSELAARLARWARKNYLMDKGLPEELHELEESLHGRSLGNQGDAYTSLALRRAEQSEREVAELRKELERVNKYRAVEQHALRRRLHNQKTALRQLHSVLNGERKLAAGDTEQRRKVNLLLGIQEHVVNPDHVGAIESIVTRHREVIDQMHALRVQLTAAERKAEGLRVELADLSGEQTVLEDERDELKAKLAESERKLERLQQRGWHLLTVFGYNKTDAYPDQQHGALGALRGALEASSPEPAGVEAGKADTELVTRDCPSCGYQRIEGYSRCPNVDCLRDLTDDPTPTETEAPARFRVGQRVNLTCRPHKPLATSGRIEHIEGVRAMVRIDYDHTRHWVDFADLEPEEPADPAPPKPGADLEGPPGSRSVPVYLSEDGQTLAFPGGGFTTVRACVHCGVLMVGGPTACVHCVVAAERAALAKALGEP